MEVDVGCPIANVGRGWNSAPTGSSTGTDITNVSAAMWISGGMGRREVSAAKNDRMFSLGIAVRRLRCETFVDGKKTFDGVAEVGGANLIRAGESPRGIMTDGWSMLHVYIPDDLLRRVVGESDIDVGFGSVELVSPLWSVDPLVARVGGAIVEELSVSDPFGRLRLDALGLELSVGLLRSHSNLPRSTNSKAFVGGLSRQHLRTTVDAIEDYIEEDLGLYELARRVGLSPTHLSRAFKQSVGVSPFRWLRRRRIERAKMLLADRSASIAGIALSVGFSAQPQFTTAFRRETGVTPAAWRRAHL